MTHAVQLRLGVALLAALALAGWFYFDSLAGIARMWDTDASYSHGLLIPPIVLWLLWRNRAEILAVDWWPSWWGAAACVAAVSAWIVASGVGVQVVEQLAVVALVPALVLGVLGARALRTVGFPMLLLFFAVPFGKGLMPWLMKITADLSVKALVLTGIPVYRSGMVLSIPEGDFEVARACSGLNYLTVGVVLGVLYAFLAYRSWAKRLAFIAASVVIPILANSLRVYLTVAVAHASDMRWGTGLDHVIGGRVLFILILLLMFWIGQRWADRPLEGPSSMAGSVPSHGLPGTREYAIVVACMIPLALGPTALRGAIADFQAAISVDGSIVLPAARDGWSGPDRKADSWTPAYSGAAEEARATYRNADGDGIEIFVGEYQIGARDGREMIAYGNYVVPHERESLLTERRVEIDLGNGTRQDAREISFPSDRDARVVWLWYQVGTQTTVRPWMVKVLEGLEFIRGRGATERVISIAARAENRESAIQRLSDYVASYADCVGTGFGPPGCGG